MDYDEHFETLDDLLSTINDAIQDRAETGVTDPYFSYMFDKDDGVFDDMENIEFPLSPLH